MAKIKGMKTIPQRYAKNSLEAFLRGSQGLAWIVGVIRSSGVRGQALGNLFRGLQGYGDPVRFRNAYQACRERGWLP